MRPAVESARARMQGNKSFTNNDNDEEDSEHADVKAIGDPRCENMRLCRSLRGEYSGLQVGPRADPTMNKHWNLLIKVALACGVADSARRHSCSARRTQTSERQ